MSPPSSLALARLEKRQRAAREALERMKADLEARAIAAAQARLAKSRCT